MSAAPVVTLAGVALGVLLGVPVGMWALALAITAGRADARGGRGADGAEDPAPACAWCGVDDAEPGDDACADCRAKLVVAGRRAAREPNACESCLTLNAQGGDVYCGPCRRASVRASLRVSRGAAG